MCKPVSKRSYFGICMLSMGFVYSSDIIGFLKKGYFCVYVSHKWLLSESNPCVSILIVSTGLPNNLKIKCDKYSNVYLFSFCRKVPTL